MRSCSWARTVEPESSKAEMQRRRTDNPPVLSVVFTKDARERSKGWWRQMRGIKRIWLIRHLCSTIIMSWRCECMYPSYKDMKKPVACVDSWQCMVLKCMEGVQLAELKPSEVMSQQYGVLFAYGGAYSPKRSVHQCFFFIFILEERRASVLCKS